MDSQLSYMQLRLMKETDIDDVMDIINSRPWAYLMTRSKLEIIHRERFSKVFVLDDVRGSNILGSQYTIEIHTDILNFKFSGVTLSHLWTGMAIVTRTRDQEALMGNVVIHKDFRGRGLGTKMMRGVLKHTSDVTLTWFSGANSFYKNLGCKMVDHETAMEIQLEIDRQKINSYCQRYRPATNVKVIPLTDSMMAELVQYDQEARGYEAKAFLSVMRKTEDEILLAISGSDERIVGYTILQAVSGGPLYINGLYADDDHIAALLVRESVTMFPDWKLAEFCMKYPSNQFILKFGALNITAIEPRFTSGPLPTRIPDRKLYCMPQTNLMY